MVPWADVTPRFELSDAGFDYVMIAVRSHLDPSPEPNRAAVGTSEAHGDSSASYSNFVILIREHEGNQLLKFCLRWNSASGKEWEIIDCSAA